MDKGKLSIIIPIYNTSKYLRKCLDSVIAQTYKNLEIILVNDCSTDNSLDIINEYCKKDDRFKLVNNNPNLGLFRARLAGAKEATGDYIAFLDSDDYLTVDFYRTMMYKIERTKADMVVGNTILEYDDGKKIIFGISDMQFNTLEKNNILDTYFGQRGLNFSWHTIWNKIYTMKLWKQAESHYANITSHLIMTEDFAFSTVLFYYAKKMTTVENDGLYYCKHESSSSTSLAGLTIKKCLKNLNDLIMSFNFVEDFMKSVGIFEKYKEDFYAWKKLYRAQQESYLELTGFTKEERKQALEKIIEFYHENEKTERADYFSCIQTDWNDKYEKIKQEICDSKIEYISFDIFDTLIVRPFLNPSDLFILLDDKFRTLSKGKIGVDFSKMRVNAEIQARSNLSKNKSKDEEITLDDIYDVLNNDYNISTNITNKMKQLEIDAEIRFCTRRNSAYELYEMALCLGKKVICTSDMYLPKDVIKKILENNGYNNISNIFLSSEIKLTKSTGNLYAYVKKQLAIDSSQLLHIGDNYISDIDNAKNNKIKAMHLRKTTDVFFDTNVTGHLGQLFTKDLPDWQDNVASMQFLGVRTMIAMVANKYFDNPYRSFNKDTEFNGDSYFMGYYAVGMHLYAVTKWLIDSARTNNYDSIVFMARDGYLPMEAYKLFKKIYKDIPEEKYLYISRKASIPLVVKDEHDLYKLTEIISWYNNTPSGVIKYVKNVFDIDEKKLTNICKKENIDLEQKFNNETELYKFISLLSSNFFNQKEHTKKLLALEKYFNNYFVGKSCVFDIGYSARPELFLSELCKKGIDTYFININHEEGIKHAKLGNFQVKTFYDYKPRFTGLLREILFSKCAPSCIEYKIENQKVTEVFEEYRQTYIEKFLMDKIQNAALDFIKDMIDVFKEDIGRLYYQNYYVSMPYELLLQSASSIDRKVMDAIVFEDDIRNSTSISVKEQWENEIKWHNQHSLNDLIKMEKLNDSLYGIDLSKRSKFVKLIYYVFINRVPLKSKISNKLSKHKMIYSITSKGYKLLRKTKNKFYRIVLKFK